MDKYVPELHRQSIRLKSFNYSEAGGYFLTTCTKSREPYFVKYPELKQIAESEIVNLPERYASIIVDTFIVMPNHIHAILFLVQPESKTGVEPIQKTGTKVVPTIGQIFGAYKSICVKKWSEHQAAHYLDRSATFWQRNYYEHVIRNERELNSIREYIVYNPMNWEFDRDNPDHIYNEKVTRQWAWLENW
jgi:putative transposase